MITLDLPERYNAVTTFVDGHVEAGRADRVAIRYGDEEITYGRVYSMVNRCGNVLLSLGVEMENRVLLLLPDSPELVYAFFGAMKIGAVPVPVNNRLTAQDYLYILNDSRAKVLVLAEALLPAIESIRPQLKYLKHALVVGPAPPGYLGFHELLSAASPDLDPADTHRDDVAFWLYSSGSTGLPKGVVHLHHDWIHCCEFYAKGVLGITPEDVSLSVSKCFHAYGLGNVLIFPFYVGGCTVLYPDVPRPEPFLAAAERNRVSLFYGVPTFFALALAIPDIEKKYPLRHLRLCVSAGEPLPAAVYTRWKERFGVEILDGIGSTEVLHIYISSRPGRVKPGSCGQPVEGYDVRILDDRGRELGLGETGTLWVRGESVTPYFWNKHQKTKAQIVGEWYNTGDRWHRDEEGYFWYAGRSDDAFKSRGEWVEPVEIENVLIEHEAVLESGVVGVEDRDGLLKPMAFVVLKPGFAASETLADELRAFVRSRLAGYKVPTWIRFVSDLPKTATGKIQRFRLRDEAAAARAEA
ncbi:MAG: benzoate-CoA ligase family protein [Clostridia bacterium]|jgi:benzoate-CoA ligase|nr:benzoate-CoA ligase family protein [Clostridia bacterium]MDH7573147.1 benzoate-CoA ligase family protein [Clostridia bacterium]